MGEREPQVAHPLDGVQTEAAAPASRMAERLVALEETDAGIEPHHPDHVVFDGYSVLVTSDDGDFSNRERGGLWHFDTRILSRHRLTVDGHAPRTGYSSRISTNTWTTWLEVPFTGGSPSGPRLPQDKLGIHLFRRVTCGMLEVITVRNHSAVAADVTLALELDADFADVLAAMVREPPAATITRARDDENHALLFRYRARHQEHTVERALRVRVISSSSPTEFDGCTLRAHLSLPPRGEWSVTLGLDSLVDGRWRMPDASVAQGRTALRRHWTEQRTHFETGDRLVQRTVECAANDLHDLRNFELDASDDAWVPNAGMPRYTGLFGRDALTSAWQAAMLGPQLLRGVIIRLAELQAGERDDWREAEPGKLPHEVRRGPLAELGVVPHRAYYGSQTTSTMFVVALSEFWHWTGDLAFVARYAPVARRALDWAARDGDPDRDGFLEYEQHALLGLKNQGWKDSDEAIRYPDGRLVTNPIATVEEQAYHFVALQRMAELCVALDDEETATGLIGRARELQKQWNDSFWIPEERFYAMALDAQKQQVRSIASDPSHALAAGIVPVERARLVADRLVSDELFSGWGMRTLSARHPSYNPFAYHLGTVWPVENATCALGMRRYGLDDHADKVISAMFRAASCFRACRLPEVFSGESTTEAVVPMPYPGSNSPQAWSASATVQLLQVMLGIFPFAPLNTLLLVRPRLPPWLPWVVVRGLRVGDSRVSLEFRRDDDGGTHHVVLGRSGPLHVVTVPAPFTGPDGPGESFKRFLFERAPGRHARMVRLAAGVMD